MNILLILFTSLFISDTEDILEKVKDRYESAQGLEIQFEQENYYSLADFSSETKGRFLYQKESVFFFETGERILVTNGETVWEHNKESGQVLINDYSAGSTVSPRSFLFDYEKNYHSELLREEKNMFVLRLIPKEGVRTSDREVFLWIEEDKFIIKKIEQHKLNDNKTIFNIIKVNFKPKMTEKNFIFEINEKKHNVVDMRF
jgi:outer membrane lipoprotein-sorting protein